MRQLVQPDTLWEMVRLGHSTAFRTLFDTYWEELYHYAVRVLKDGSAAQDAIQCLFVHLWESHTDLPHVASVPAYLRAALRNRLLNAIRDEQLYQQHVGQFGEAVASADNSLLDTIHFRETESALLRSIDQLPDRMKTAFYMHRIQHLTVAEIAQRLGSSEQTIRNQINTALRRIRIQWHALPFLLFYILN
ncbi:sigma-70 family RNA polymerase sigma factor [Chitinophaga caseinilytica]|uniref:sigma-70 family RNA polymerase sigma factor n=1 Tax=Chitinophaga caseinilytica TaxID=2267521 RepID=UPI003C2F820B